MGDFLKEGGALGQFPDLRRGLARKRGVVLLRGVDTPMHTLLWYLPENVNRISIMKMIVDFNVLFQYP